MRDSLKLTLPHLQHFNMVEIGPQHNMIINRCRSIRSLPHSHLRLPHSLRALHICLLAGEPSGDEIGAHLIRSLNTVVPATTPLHITGVGGPHMRKACPQVSNCVTIIVVTIVTVICIT